MIDQTKSTPGPWKWFMSPDTDTKKPHMKHFIGSNGQGFALTVGLSEPEDTANAALIAAAPALVEALERIKTDTVLDKQSADYYKRIMLVWKEWAHAALRLARGTP